MSPALTLSDSENQIGHSIYSFWHFFNVFCFLFQETYPSTPPVWFSESDNVNVTNALTSLSETSGINNHLCYQVKSLLRQLCTLFSLPLPVECTDSDSNSSGCSTGKKSYLLHFVAFFHVASLFSTGVDNEKALELTNNTVFHRGRQ